MISAKREGGVSREKREGGVSREKREGGAFFSNVNYYFYKATR